MNFEQLDKLQDQIDHKFNDSVLLKTALTHSSSAIGYNYERLEFLGDRVLGLVIAELLYERFPQESEGDMAKRLAALVQGSFLAQTAIEMGLGSYINLSDGEAHAGGAQNEHILADVFESLIGALYIDAGFKKCQDLIHKLWQDRMDVMKEPPQHPKTKIQEWAQGKSLPLPIYEITGQDGPDHAPMFEVELTVQGFPTVKAAGKSRQVAEKEAAHLFINLNLNENENEKGS